MLVLGYCGLGLLIGFLVGMTSSPVANTLIATIFTFAGGSITYLLEKASNFESGENEQSDEKSLKKTPNLIGAILFSFSMACFVGVLAGITIKENRLLSNLDRIKQLQEFEQNINEQSSENFQFQDYLKNQDLEQIFLVNQQYRNKDISAEEAYEELFKAVMSEESEN